MAYTPASSSFPTSLDTPTDPTGSNQTEAFDHAGLEAFQNDAIESIQGKVGVDSSGVSTSLDYKLNNSSSSNPGHTHTLANGATDVTATADELNILSGVTSLLTLATTSEIDTGTDSTKAMPIDQFVASTRNVKFIDIRVLPSVSSQSVSSTVGGDFEIPFTGTLTVVGGYVDVAGTTGTATYDINLNESTIMTTNKISIETGEKSSRDAATQPVLTTTAVTAGDIVTVDIDAVQTGTAAKGLVIRLEIRQS